MTWENRLTFEVSSADPDSATPVWVDLTLRIRDIVQQIEVSTGRQNDLDRSEPTVFTLVVDNSDDALTYGNTASPYASWWGPGRKCRLRETVGGVAIDVATGYLQMPTETLTTQGIEHRVSLTIVDTLARLGSSEPFISTLAAYIAYAGGTVLKAYVPLHQQGNTDEIVGVGGSTIVKFTKVVSRLTLAEVTTSRPVMLPGSGGSPPGDDVPSFLFDPILSSAGIPQFMGSLSARNVSIAQASGETISFVAWITNTGPSQNCQLLGLNSTPTVSVSVQAITGVWTFQVITGGFVSLTLPTFSQGGPQLVAFRITLPSGLVEYWRNNDPPVTGVVGSAPTSTTWSTFSVGLGYSGSVGHFQVHVGNGAYTHDQHVAQWEMGLHGLDRQPTGERIRTVAQYAGVRDADMNIDPGVSIMQPAELAGLTPLDAMRDAERTEQGLIYVDGSGVLQSRDRRSLYNI